MPLSAVVLPSVAVDPGNRCDRKAAEERVWWCMLWAGDRRFCGRFRSWRRTTEHNPAANHRQRTPSKLEALWGEEGRAWSWLWLWPWTCVRPRLAGQCAPTTDGACSDGWLSILHPVLLYIQECGVMLMLRLPLPIPHGRACMVSAWRLDVALQVTYARTTGWLARPKRTDLPKLPGHIRAHHHHIHLLQRERRTALSIVRECTPGEPACEI